MQFPQPNTLGNIEPEGGAAGSQLPTQPASMYPRDFSSPDRDEFLSLLNPDGDRRRTGSWHWIGMGWRFYLVQFRKYSCPRPHHSERNSFPSNPRNKGSW